MSILFLPGSEKNRRERRSRRGLLHDFVQITPCVDHARDRDALFRFVHPVKNPVMLRQQLPILMLQRADRDVGRVRVRKFRDALGRLDEPLGKARRGRRILQVAADVARDVDQILPRGGQKFQAIQRPRPLWRPASRAGRLWTNSAGRSARPRARPPGA